MKSEILKYYGNKKQIIKLIEEMSELTKVLCKYLNSKIYLECNLEYNYFVNELKEEIADVINMLDYLPLMFNIDKQELQKIMFEKTKRTIERI